MNTKPSGSVISRQDVIAELRRNDFIAVEGFFEHKDKDRTLYSTATLDSARNMAENVVYLGKTARLGYYEVLNHFSLQSTPRKSIEKRL